MGGGIFSTSPPYSPSPYEVVKGEGEDIERGAAPLLDAPWGGGENYG